MYKHGLNIVRVILEIRSKYNESERERRRVGGRERIEKGDSVRIQSYISKQKESKCDKE